MATSTVSVGLPTFSGTGSVSRFIADFKTFSTLQDWDVGKQASLMPLCLSGIARDAYDALPVSCKKDVKDVFERLKVIFPSVSIVEAQVRLRSLKFKTGDNLDSFIVQLKGLVSRAFPGTEGDELLFNYFLQSLPTEYQQALVSEGIQSFELAVGKIRNIACAARLAADAQPSVRQVSAEPDSLYQSVQELKAKLARLEQSRYAPPYGGQMSGRGRVCFCCGMAGHLQSACRRRHLPCHSCGKVGHLARVCVQPVNPQRAGMAPDPRPEQRQPHALGMRGPVPQWGVRPPSLGQQPRTVGPPAMMASPPPPRPARGSSA